MKGDSNRFLTITLLALLTSACSKDPSHDVASTTENGASKEAARSGSRGIEVTPIETTNDALVFEVVLHEKGRLVLAGGEGLGHGLDGVGPTAPAEPILVRIDLEETSGEDFLAGPVAALLGQGTRHALQESHPEVADRSMVVVSCRLSRARSNDSGKEETIWRDRAYFVPPAGTRVSMQTVASGPMRRSGAGYSRLVRWVYRLEGEDISVAGDSNGRPEVRINDGPPLEGRDLTDRVLEIGLHWTPTD